MGFRGFRIYRYGLLVRNDARWPWDEGRCQEMDRYTSSDFCRKSTRALVHTDLSSDSTQQASSRSSTLTRMADHASLALSLLVLSIAATVWANALPSFQAEANPARRDFYGSANPEFFAAYLNDHGSPREKVAEREDYWSGSRGGNVSRMSKGSIDRGSEYRSEEEAENRISRNLDHIGGGNLLRRRLAERFGQPEGSPPLYRSGGWLASRRNLDQIGGGNLLREAVDRDQRRNLDHIGGGNLVRDLDGPLVPDDHLLRRNLDQIGGGNLVRSIAETARETEDRRLDETCEDVARGNSLDHVHETPRVRSPPSNGQAARNLRYLFHSDQSSPYSQTIALLPSDRELLERFVKRNIDEIDRTAFDNFFKRNLREIDRLGWSGFVKRTRANALSRRG
ncbi:uncharacterized protein LOC143221423 [Lasioglossum baleicum]|uniref:uncharacterized protein LOC143221423 n=1 Tax=Lasioglossum baleicum TaxID=434251 RepID=UPI003FCDF573